MRTVSIPYCMAFHEVYGVDFNVYSSCPEQSGFCEMNLKLLALLLKSMHKEEITFLQIREMC